MGSDRLLAYYREPTNLNEYQLIDKYDQIDSDVILWVLSCEEITRNCYLCITEASKELFSECILTKLWELYCPQIFEQVSVYNSKFISSSWVLAFVFLVDPCQRFRLKMDL